jgi:hypothetical protein
VTWPECAVGVLLMVNAVILSTVLAWLLGVSGELLTLTVVANCLIAATTFGVIDTQLSRSRAQSTVHGRDPGGSGA